MIDNPSTTTESLCRDCAQVKTKRGTLTRDQEDFAELWPFHVLRSPDDAIAMVQTIRKAA